MKNSEFLSTLEMTGGIEGVRDKVSVYWNEIDKLGMDLCGFWSRFSKYDKEACFKLMVDFIGSWLNREEYEKVSGLMEFVLETFTSREDIKEMFHYFACDIDLFSIKEIYNDVCFGEDVVINNEQYKLVDNDLVKDRKIVYKNVKYIEKDIDSNKVYVICSDKEGSLQERTYRIKIV